MSVFDGCDGGDASLVLKQAAQGLSSRRPHAAEAWSTCEAGLDERDYCWLRNWLRELSPTQTGGFLSRGRDRARFGLLFLAMAAEECRSAAREDHAWPVVAALRWPDAVRRRLFTRDGDARAALRDAIKRACMAYRLRHSFGEDGGQAWFTTIALQHGFTRLGFRSRLPEWLVGQGQPRGVRGLLRGQDASQSFYELWEELRSYRRGDLPECELRRSLLRCVWVLPEWADDLLRFAAARRELGDACRTESGTAVAEALQELDSVDTAEQFLGEPRLRWTESAPVFSCDVRPAALYGAEFAEYRYDLLVDGVRCGRLFRTETGNYRPDPACVEFPPSQLEAEATVVRRDGRIVLRQPLGLWEAGEDVTAFDLTTGKAFDAWDGRFSPQRRYVLLVADDLETTPPGRVAPCGDHRFVEPPADGLAEWAVNLEGQPYWTPWIVAARQRPEIACRVTASQSAAWTDDAVAAAICLAITHPADATVRFVRGVRCMGALRERGPLTTELDATMFDDRPREAATIIIGLKGPEGLATSRHRVMLPMTPAYRTAEGWRPFRRGLELDLARVSHGSVELGPPPGKPFRPDDRRERERWGQECKRWGVMEGEFFIASLDRGRPLERAGGWGGPLRLRHDPLAMVSGDQDVWLASSVVDRGIVREVKLDAASRLLRMTLAYAIEPGERHAVVMLDRRGGVSVIGAESVVADGCDWWIEVRNLTAFSVAAIAYDGERLGAWWEHKWERSLFGACIATAENAYQSAAAIRWFKLPMLSPSVETAARRFAGEFPAACLTAWICADRWWTGTGAGGDVSGLRHAEPDEAWWAAVRELLTDVSLSPAHACEIDAAAFQSGKPAADPLGNFRLGPLADRLWRLPVLMAKVIDALTAADPRQRRLAIQPLLDALDKEAKEAQEEAGGQKSSSSRACSTVPDEACRQWLADIAAGIVRGELQNLRDRKRLNMPLTSSDFREFLIRSLLRNLLNQEGRTHVPA